MTTAVLTIRHRSALTDRPVLASVLLLCGAIVTAAAAVAGNGNVAIALIPFVLAIGAYGFYVLPVRYSLFALIFLSLTLDAVEEGPWSSPLAPLGTLLAFNLNKSLPIEALKIPGVAVVLLAMLALLAHRGLVGSRIDRHGRTPIPLPFFGALAISLITVLLLVAIGQKRGGDIQMAKIQVQNHVLMLLMAYVVALSLRGVQDYRILGRLFVAAAVARAFYIFVAVHELSFLMAGEELAVAATHGDSLLFAGATVLLLVRFLEKPSQRSAFWCLTLIPILCAAMSLNNRRLVWVQIAAGVLTVAIVSRRSRVKRILANAVLLSLPLIATYIAVGWNSQAKIFGPIQTYRSVSDGEVDASTLYRDLENYNLILTMRMAPFTGLGFGQQFVQEVVLPDISFVFKEFQYIPHNAILGLFGFAGALGFTGLMMPLVVVVYFAVRSYRMARSPDERTAALMTVAFVAIYLVHCWGDMGFSERRTIFLMGPALAIASQLAFITGGFGEASRVTGQGHRVAS